MKRVTASAIVLLSLSLPALAAEEAAKSTGQQLLTGLLPVIIIFTMLWFVLRKVSKRNAPYMERATIHMDRLEKQNKEIITLLKDLSKANDPEH
jgi:hypothetical protein